MAGTEGEQVEDEEESQNHTVSTIVESDRINFDGQGEDDDDDFLEDPHDLHDLAQNREKDDITQFSRNKMKMMLGSNKELASSKKRPRLGKMNNTGGLSSQRVKKKGISSVRSISSKRSEPVGLSADEDYEPEPNDDDSGFNQLPLRERRHKRKNRMRQSAQSNSSRRQHMPDTNNLSLALPARKMRYKKRYEPRNLKFKKQTPVRLDGSSPYAEFMP